jgi:hypothetical protein
MVTEAKVGVSRGDSPLGGVWSYKSQMAAPVTDLIPQDFDKAFKGNCNIRQSEECKNHYYSLIKFFSVVL